MTAYETLYNSADEYMSLLSSAKSNYELQQAKNGLTECFPYLFNGAIFYQTRGEKGKMNKFVNIYMEIATNDAMQDEELPKNEEYATCAWMAAKNAWDSKDYKKVVKYLNEYINSGATNEITEAFAFMARSYIKMNEKEHAKKILEQGLTLYPDNLEMLTIIINLLAETKTDDVELQKYVSRALLYKPTDEGLLNIQAQLFERNEKFERAIEFYSKLSTKHPDNIDVKRHLATNYYNAGVDYYKKAEFLKNGGKHSKSEIKAYDDRARKYFESAAGIFSQILYNDPLAVNYAYALGKAYAHLGDTKKLQEINDKLVALNLQPVENIPDAETITYSKKHVAMNLLLENDKANTAAVENKKAEASQKKLPKKKIISDVDINIPINSETNTDTYVVVIANEKYDEVADVPNAANDGEIFAEYCNKVLGVPKKNIRSWFNVTYGKMRKAMNDITDIAKREKGNCNIIFYYAGHGMPDEETKQAYILPVDADGKDKEGCYSLGELYDKLGSLEANCATVFIDACFSGATRTEGEMLFSARSIAFEVDESEIDGRLVVFSAATGNQTALAYDEKKHGLFTYFLLKKLQETNGDISLSELGDYLCDEVALQARLVNYKSQTPTVVAGSDFGNEWRNIKLK